MSGREPIARPFTSRPNVFCSSSSDSLIAGYPYCVFTQPALFPFDHQRPETEGGSQIKKGRHGTAFASKPLVAADTRIMRLEGDHAVSKSIYIENYEVDAQSLTTTTFCALADNGARGSRRIGRCTSNS